jgi:putative DNA primase/helicase
MRETANNARGRWPGILQTLGVDPKFLRDIHGPCPICGGRDRWRFDDKQNGNFYCSKCGSGDGFKLLELLHGWDFKRAADEVDKIVGTIPETPTRPERSENDKRAYMGKLWKESRLITPGDPAWLYLKNRCGADPSPYLQDLRLHPALKHSVDGGTHPALLAMMGWDGKRYSGIHRTYLDAGGHKAQVDPVRMSYGDVGPVRLGPVLGQMGIAEGIETAICASLRFRLPVWSAISADGMTKWDPPDGCNHVEVFGDCDESFTGQAAAYVLAKRLKAEGYSVGIKIPELVGTDWASEGAGALQPEAA